VDGRGPRVSVAAPLAIKSHDWSQLPLVLRVAVTGVRTAPVCQFATTQRQLPSELATGCRWTRSVGWTMRRHRCG